WFWTPRMAADGREEGRVDSKRLPRAPARRARAGKREARRWQKHDRWHAARHWAGIVCWVVCSVTAVSAQEGRWARVTAAGVQAFAQGDYAAAVWQFQAALPLADTGSLVPSCMNLAAVYYAQEQYTDAARLYQRALVLQEQVLGPDDPQLLPLLEANA